MQEEGAAWSVRTDAGLHLRNMIVQFIDMGKIIKTKQEDPAVSLMLQQLCYRIFTGCLGKQSGDGIYFAFIL